jgi:hypothetical protein
MCFAFCGLLEGFLFLYLQMFTFAGHRPVMDTLLNTECKNRTSNRLGAKKAHILIVRHINDIPKTYFVFKRAENAHRCVNLETDSFHDYNTVTCLGVRDNRRCVDWILGLLTPITCKRVITINYSNIANLHTL